MPGWITVKRVAQLRKCSERYILMLIHAKELPAKKEGRRWLVQMDVPEETSEVEQDTSEVTSALESQLEEKDRQIEELKAQLAAKMDALEAASEAAQNTSEVTSAFERQLEEKDGQLKLLQEQVAKLQDQLGEASHRHDTVVMQMTRMLEYHQQPFWRRWRKRKQLPEATFREEEQ